jgi:glutathione synthase/RimK-type ligase-like ATP-grasp enzyme
MNLSAGGTMVLEDLQADAALILARTAVRALGLRAAAVDLFTDLPGGADPMRVIEVNANPSIRLLEDSDRSDLILNIWHHSFASLGLL